MDSATLNTFADMFRFEVKRRSLNSTTQIYRLFRRFDNDIPMFERRKIRLHALCLSIQFQFLIKDELKFDLRNERCDLKRLPGHKHFI